MTIHKKPIRLLTIPADENGSRFQTIMAIMIAAVTLIGAVVAWRIAITTEAATDADFAGMQAVLAAEETNISSDVDLFRHYRAYTEYSVYDGLQETLDSAFESEIALASASTNQLFFPKRYLNRDGSYAVQRQLGELWADAGQDRNLNAVPHFAESTILRNKVSQLTGIFILLTMSLFFYTSAEAIYHERKQLRYLLGAIGTLLLLATVITALFIELQS